MLRLILDRSRLILAGIVSWGLVAHLASAAPMTQPAAGLRENTPAAHALVGARIVVAPGQVIDAGTVVVRDGLIVAVGADVAVPPDARTWDMRGKTLYAGFIDAYAELPPDLSRGPQPAAGAVYWNSQVLPHVEAAPRYVHDPAVNLTLRSQGITARLVAPSAGVIKGTSALVSTLDEGGSRSILRPQVALHVQLTPEAGGRDQYPNSPMGAVALIRQALHDANWYRQAWEVFESQPGVPRPERNEALDTLSHATGNGTSVIIDAPDELYFLRAASLASEFGLTAIVRGSGREYRRLDAIKATDRPIIVPLNFPKAPNVTTAEAAMSMPLERLLHWDLAPENPGRLVAAGVKIAFTTSGLADTSTFVAAVRKAVDRGLNADEALRALTITPAELFGMAGRLGTLEVGKSASLVVTDGDLFAASTRLIETWVDGKRFEVVPRSAGDLRGTWEVQIIKPDGGTETLVVELRGESTALTGVLKRGDKQTDLVQPAFDAGQFTFSFKGEPLAWEGIVQLSGTVSVPTPPAPSANPADPPAETSWLGFVSWADGRISACRARRTSAELPAAAPPVPAPPAEGVPAPGEAPANAPAAAVSAEPAAPAAPKQALFAVQYPLGGLGVAGPPAQPPAVAFQHATVWTSGPQGILENVTLIVRAGKIEAVGPDLPVPADALVIDATGKHVSPGIIDCHSHIATDGGVNESGQTITAEVRIGDFIDPDDVNIYRQLAGGVTCSNILHGSANTIGGQNQVLKFRWGALPEEMKFAGAPPGIKFALGENVKQSNWGDQYSTRYPQSRMGVEQLVKDAFRAAKDYTQQWQEWKASPKGLPPRTDLELEALAEVLDGRRLIHCHSYRQDEILAFLRTCEEFGVRVRTMQHILEGYKLADVLARHGAGGSSFSDWWAYKFEVYDAIPYNGTLMHRAGVVVSFNSDDAELARRLNLEAAKAVKYGGVSPHEALQFVTLNPARQLGIDGSVGSIEPGKDADLAIWNGSPLSTLSRCEQTWIDGRKYFDRNEDAERRKQAAQMRAALVQRVLASGEPTETPQDLVRQHWAREDIFCDHGHDHSDR